MIQGIKVRRGTIRIVIGAVFAVMGCIALSDVNFYRLDSDETMGITLFAGIVILLLYSGTKARKRYNMYSRYTGIIANRTQISIESIASTTKDSIQEVTEALRDMLKKGFYPGAYINENSKMLVLANETVSRPVTTDTQKSVTSNEAVPHPAVSAQPSAIKCRGCGAVNTVVPGSHNECEYCGSPL